MPPADPADRYSIRRLTFAWLAEAQQESVHTARAYFRDLTSYLTWCAGQRLDPLIARATEGGQYRVALHRPDRRADPPRRAGAAHGGAAAIRRQQLVPLPGRQQRRTGGRQPPSPACAAPRWDRDVSTTTGLTLAEVDALLDKADAEVAARTAALPAVPTAGQHARRLAALRDRALIRLLADLGLRVGEGLALDVLGYNRAHRTVRYLGKGGKPRERAVSPHALEAIDAYLAERARSRGMPPDRLHGPLFATSGRDGLTGRLDEPAAFRLIRRLARAAGLPSADRLSPHSLRHAFATNARELDIPLEDVQDAAELTYDTAEAAAAARRPGPAFVVLPAVRPAAAGFRHRWHAAGDGRQCSNRSTSTPASRRCSRVAGWPHGST